MDVSELDYDLPAELIAQRPAERRDSSRLLVYDRRGGETRHRTFAELPDELDGALVVVNDTRVVPARIPIDSPRGEVLLLERTAADEWIGLARPTRRLKAGRRYGPVELLEHLGDGRGRHAAPAVHHRAARRSRALPDRLRPRSRLRRGADRRPPFHARAPRPPRR